MVHHADRRGGILYSKMSTNIALVAVYAGLFAISTPRGAAAGPISERCTGIPSNEANPPVEVCEGPATYRFRIEDTVTVYSKADYRERIETQARDYALRAGLPDDALAGATVTFWLSVPEASPADAWARAVIKSATHHFLVNFPLDLGNASVESNMVANLGQREYPDYLGHRVGNIIVKKSPGATDSDFRDYIVRAGAKGWTDSAGGWTKFLTADFGEVALIEKILHDPGSKSLVAGAQVNELFEWIAWREPVFRFGFQNH